MAFKPNYSQQRAERTRAAQAKKEAKQRARDEATARRKAEREAAAPMPPDADTPRSS